MEHLKQFLETLSNSCGKKTGVKSHNFLTCYFPQNSTLLANEIDLTVTTFRPSMCGISIL